MSDVQDFQIEVATKMSLFFQRKLTQLQAENNEFYIRSVQDYIRQQEVIIRDDHENQYRRSTDYVNVLIKGLSESVTEYWLDDFQQNPTNNRKIYSPRVDIAFTPALQKHNMDYVSIGVKKLTMDVMLYKNLNQLPVVRDIECALRIKSNENMQLYSLQQNHDSIDRYNDNEYINKRPLFLFGFEIENSETIKYLMGDFLNILSLARIPSVIVPESNLENCMNMLMFCSTIGDIKEVPIYNLLKKVNVLTVGQLRTILNEFLIPENIAPIGVLSYR
jgi:hypothetical protein